MDEPLESTWASRDLPILRAALRRLDGGDLMPSLEEIRQELGLTGDELLIGIKALEGADPPYIEVGLAMGWSEDRANGHVIAVSERARRELGTWPSPESLVDAIAAALAQAAEQAPTAEEKGRLRGAAEALAGMARDIAVQVAAARLGQL